jgi:hypothetical protein
LEAREVELHNNEYLALTRYLDPDCLGGVELNFLREVLTAEMKVNGGATAIAIAMPPSHAMP